MNGQDTNILNNLVKQVHEDNLEAGWWKDPKTGEDLTDNVYVQCTKLALIHSELSEALEGLRKGKMDDHLQHRKAVEVELADTVIRILDLAGALKLDLGGAIAQKQAYNKQRQDHKMANRAKEGGKAF